MKNCLSCGAVMDDHEWADHSCENTDPPAAVSVEAAAGRPSGLEAIHAGKLLTASGLVTVVVSTLASISTQNEVSSYSSAYQLAQATESAAFFWAIALIGSGLLSVGILLWCVGYIVHAISWLPGKENDH